MSQTSNGQNGHGGEPGEDPTTKAPDPTDVVDHLRAATVEIVAAGRAFLDMMEQAFGDFLSTMTGRGEEEAKAKGDKPRVEKIDVEDERKKEED